VLRENLFSIKLSKSEIIDELKLLRLNTWRISCRPLGFRTVLSRLLVIPLIVIGVVPFLTRIGCVSSCWESSVSAGVSAVTDVLIDPGEKR
jgi:hypothetical protein